MELGVELELGKNYFQIRNNGCFNKDKVFHEMAVEDYPDNIPLTFLQRASERGLRV